MSVFIPTRHNNPCQVCSNTTGKCREVGQTLLCMTFADALEAVPGLKFIGQTKDGLWGKWVVDSGQGWIPSSWQPNQGRRRQSKQTLATAQPQPLSADERDALYRQLLNQLSLHPTDQADLLQRGLTQEQISAWGVRSVEQWQPLIQELPCTLPGINLAQSPTNSRSRSLNTPFPGYLCPIQDGLGRIVGLQIRSRTPGPDTPKYYWLTSKTKKHPQGPTPHLANGELPLAVHRPQQILQTGVALVEGTGPKPFVTAQRLGIVTIGAAGGQFGSSPQTLHQILEQTLSSCDVSSSGNSDRPRVQFYPDAGAVCNLQVLRQYRMTWKLLQSWGYEVQVMWWNQLTKAAPDIDELSDFSQVRPLTVAEFEAIARQPQNLLTQIKRLFRLGRKSRQPTSGSSLTPSIPTPKTTAQAQIVEYQSSERLQTWQHAIAQGYRYILDSSTTGTGKSFDAGTVAPTLFSGARQVIYASDQHRNPTVATLTANNGWLDLEARHGGLTQETTANGGKRLRRSHKGEMPHIAANCSRNRVVNTLRTKHVSGADTASLICHTCPLYEACTHSQGAGYGFLHQRRSALSASKLRAHPDSLLVPGDYDYEDVIVIWDEPGQTFRIKQALSVALEDLEQVIMTLMRFPDLFEPLRPLLAALVPYLDGSAQLGKFGLTHTQVLAQLPKPLGLEISAVEQVLRPNLSFLNTTANYGIDLADLPAQIRKKFSERDSDMAEQAGKQVIKQWLPDLLRVLTGQLWGALSIKQGLLTIALPDTRHRAIAQAAQATIFLDATLSREDLALKLGCLPEEILEVRQAIANLNNLTLTQVVDLGRMGMQRGEQQKQRAAAIISYYRQLNPEAKVIDFKKYQADGAWWRDSRGVNDFTQIKTLILVGTPCRNLNDQIADYTILTGISDSEDLSFKAFVDRAIQADFLQAIGRLRSHRRPGEQLQVILLSNFELAIPTHVLIASEVTLEAATKRERFLKAALSALKQLETQGQKLTQVAIAEMIGYSQQYLSRYWKLLLLLLKESHNESSNFSHLLSERSQTVQIVSQKPIEPTSQIEASQLLEKFAKPLSGLPFGEWKRVWYSLPATQQINLLSVLLMTLPVNQLKLLQAALSS